MSADRPELNPNRPDWAKWIDKPHPALADLTPTSEEIEKARENNARLQAELAQAKSAIGAGLSADNEFVNQQQRLVESYQAQLNMWQDASIKTETKTWTCPNGHGGDEWQALEPFILHVDRATNKVIDSSPGFLEHKSKEEKEAEAESPVVQVESRHGEPACPTCGSSELRWIIHDPRPQGIKTCREGLATALYRLSRFDEAMNAISDGGTILAEFESLAAHIKQVMEAVYKPDEQRCEHEGDYFESDKILSPHHSKKMLAVLSAFKCRTCGNVNVTPEIDVMQPEQARLRAAE